MIDWANLRVKLQKFGGLPVPYSLPMRYFGGKDKYCWENWHEDMKKQYPIRYFLFYTIPLLFAIHIGVPFNNFIYWIKCHTLKKYKYHLLDLRDNEYKYGWIDTDTQIIYALTVLLNNFVAKEVNIEEYAKLLEDRIINHKQTEDEIEKQLHENDKETLKIYKELLELHNWFFKLKKIEIEKLKKLLGEALKLKNFDLYDKLNNDYYELESDKLKRIIELRKYMWS